MSESSHIPLVKDQPSQFDIGSYRHPIPGVDNWQQPIPLLGNETGPHLPTSYFQNSVPSVSWQCSCPLCVQSAQEFIVALRNTGRLISASIATTGPIYSSLLASVMQPTDNGTLSNNGENGENGAVSSTTAPVSGAIPDNANAGGAVALADTLTITVDNGNNGNGNHIQPGLMGGPGYPGSPYVYYYPSSMYYPPNPYMNMTMPAPAPYYNGNYYWDPNMAAGNSMGVGAPNQNAFPSCVEDAVSTNVNMDVNNDQLPKTEQDDSTVATSDSVEKSLKPEAEGFIMNHNDKSDSDISV